jgi:hypothetical protein
MVNEQERIETLQNLIKAKSDILTQFEKLPISGSGIQATKHKIDLEKNLILIEKNIGLFSRKIVFVKYN